MIATVSKKKKVGKKNEVVVETRKGNGVVVVKSEGNGEEHDVVVNTERAKKKKSGGGGGKGGGGKAEPLPPPSPKLVEAAKTIGEILNYLYPNPAIPLNHKVRVYVLCVCARYDVWVLTFGFFSKGFLFFYMSFSRFFHSLLFFF